MIDPVLTSVVSRIDATLLRGMQTLGSRIRELMGTLDSRNGKLIPVRLGVRLPIADQLLKLMQGVGDEGAREMISHFPEVLRQTVKDNAWLYRYSPRISRDVVTVAQLGIREVRAVTGLDGGQTVLDAITDVVIAGESIEQAAGPVSRALGITKDKASTAVDRAVREFHESVLKRMGADAGPPMVYRYVGPGVDSPNIRDFCKARTGKILTQAEADALDPRERFNCRHSLAPMLEVAARREGFEFFTRVSNTKQKRKA